MFDFMFNGFQVIFFIVFFLILGFILFTMFKGVKQWSYNNSQPVLSVEAKVVSKRDEVSRSAHNHDGHMHHSTRTSYYVTFEVQSGDRMEFLVHGQQFGLLAEGDFGRLTFQGTRYHGFERQTSPFYNTP